MSVPDYGIFDLDLKQRVGFARASDIEDIPNDPGIYAWYLPLRGDDGGDLFRFLHSLKSNVESYVPVTSIEATGTQRHVQIQRKGPEFDFESTTLKNLAAALGNTQIQSISRLVLMLSFLSEPFYVGMTNSDNGLKGRIEQHLASVRTFDQDDNWSGSFRTRMAHILNKRDSLRRCLIAFLTLPPELANTDSARLLEHILIRSVRPSQSKRG